MLRITTGRRMTLSQQLLQQHFGFDQFRGGQQQVIDTILAGQSAAAIFPTGSGKSLCYQLPAIALPNLTLVISPLLALMQDQLAFLADKGIPAASIDSMQTRDQTQHIMQQVRMGQIKILMVSVERLNNERFRQFLQQIPISLLVVDEAHCISEWGHNFRPDYLKLPTYKQQFHIEQTLLLTATATDNVIDDMAKKFAIETHNVTTTGFYRSNLNLYVHGTSEGDKMNLLSQWLPSYHGQSGIIYVTLQQTAENVALNLQQQGIDAQAYHAGMDSDKRQFIQKQFMQGEVKLIVATIAFGMGIDKADIRYVIHYDLPKSIENYSQEIGRAGRDSQAADCLVLANKDNINVLENFVYGDTPERSEIEFVIKELLTQGQENHGQIDIVLYHLSSQSNIRMLALKTLLVYLELVGLIKPSHSYFAEYKFKLLTEESALLAAFPGERQAFIKAMLQSSQKAKIWYNVDFDAMAKLYSDDRQRMVRAIDYLDEKGFIELQTKQMTEVYQLLNANVDVSALSQQIHQQFSVKEQNEVSRISALINFFASDQCLSKQLAEYFSDAQLTQPCGHCSVCHGQVAVLPEKPMMQSLTDHNFINLTSEISAKLGSQRSVTLLSRFLCGLTTPIFTKLRVRKLTGFAALEQYRYSDVKDWVASHL